MKNAKPKKTQPSKRRPSINRVGIRELKNKASELIRQVSETKKPISITHHGEEVARIIPVSKNQSPIDILDELNLISRRATESWSTLKLIGKPQSSKEAVQAIIDDRNED